MFRMIESEGTRVGVESYSLSLTKLEQVFLKVGEMTGTKSRKDEISTAIQQLIRENDNRGGPAEKIGMQLMHLFYKRVHYDLAHLISLVIKLALLVVIATVVPWSIMKSMKGNIMRTTSLLDIPDCYRVGLHSSMHAEMREMERVSKELGYCLSFDAFPSSAQERISSTFSHRPPILAALTKTAEGTKINTFARNEILLPALETVLAMTKNPQLKVKYTMITVDIPERNVGNDERIFFTRVTIEGMILMCTPLMIMRPIGFHIVDKTSHFAHQQRLTGIYRAISLLATVLYDFVAFNIHLLLFYIPLMISYMDVLNGMTSECLLLLITSFIHGELLTLLLDRLFSTRAMGESLLTILLFIQSICSCTALFAFTMLQKTEGLLVHPSAAVIAVMRTETSKKEYGTKSPTDDETSKYRSDAILYALLHMFALLLPLLVIEFRCIERIRAFYARKRDKSMKDIETPDLSEETAILKVRNLQKRYGLFNGVTAVDGISFDVLPHECFGVLGVNGAGKTSTFEMLTGNSSPTRGFATVGGVDCSSPATIGYCPQIDALIDDLSGFQSLVVLAALHGYRNPRKVAAILVDCVGMKAHADMSSKQYSGGQRRKISVAAALLAQNSLIILDEPTAGIDPVARRDVWNVICALREATNTAVLLTSHSMDEVETLVSTLIIMSRGKIVVTGTPQSVKNEFGAHYEMSLTIEGETHQEEITRMVQEVFPMAEFFDSPSWRIFKFRIPRNTTDIFSSVYERAELIAKELKATDFELTQATLEDAFIVAAQLSKDDGLQEVPLETPLAVSFNPREDNVKITG
ncbi:hypothetical protein PMAYCL1PPCAC_30954, partial [Pristionchus mayeri]